MHAELRLPMELHQCGLALGIDHPEGVDTETLHHPERTWDATIRHVPDGVVLALGVQRDEVPEGVVSTLCLWNLPVRMRFGSVHHIGELDPVLDEEHWDVVADQVEGALVGVELGRKAPSVPYGVGRTARTEHGREAGEDRRLLALGEERGLGDVVGISVALEDSVCRRTAGMDHPLGNAFMIEMSDLLPEMMILQQARPPFA